MKNFLKKYKKKLKNIKLYKRLFVRNKEHLGIKTLYNPFWINPVMRIVSKGYFLSDTSAKFPIWVKNMKDRKYKGAVILGNAPSLNELTKELIEKFYSNGYLTIGLNRSIYEYNTDVLAWSDVRTIDNILKKRAIKKSNTTVLHIKLERDHRLPAHEDSDFQNLNIYWSKNRNFREWEKEKLYMFRNTLIGVLNLCYKLELSKIFLIGFGFDNRDYFYKSDLFHSSSSYEVLRNDILIENCGGYDTNKIVFEVINYLIEEENFDLYYNGNSNFLKTIKGLKKIELKYIDNYMNKRKY